MNTEGLDACDGKSYLHMQAKSETSQPPHRCAAALAGRLTRLLALGCALTLGGCGASLTGWIVATRDHQGDLALDSRRYKEAALAYRLALQFDANDARAKAGLVEAEADVAQMLYADSEFDAALKELDIAEKVDPQSVRVAGLRSDIESARLKSQIVKSNYPAYAKITYAISHGYQQLRVQNEDVTALIKRFEHTYDTADLTNAIRYSVELSSSVSKLTARLAALRTLVSAGAIAPESTNGGAGVSTSGASLLPLP